MTVLLIWSMVDIQSPCIITSDKHVINLLETDPVIWASYISEENKLRVVAEVHRWESVISAGADAIEAYGYAVGGIGVDFQTWLLKERENPDLVNDFWDAIGTYRRRYLFGQPLAHRCASRVAS